ncbi:hypothetical protein [Pseudomonas sp. LD120]|uniref:hypothetical protein n=1 Tax=Pseudomonas sp. LD120 TaxID=485751 RepID=UPI001358C1C7|nr:hypothetical protein [Pseudomonas sp. LD120]KAF0863774.1 hypothetical protein PLD_24300 [Pseudomonas sp. LD120]
MQKWQVTFVDDHGVQSVELFDCDEPPTMERAAQWVRAKLLPISAELDLNDLDGRTEAPTLRSLREQNSIQILSITPI